jgi:thiosulfate/3-mercaptopyruvate sulfurtransferase
MQWTTLVSSDELALHLSSEELCIVDTRFDLADPQAGKRLFHESALPNAVYLDLDQDLSDHTQPAELGRHPMPSASVLLARLFARGIVPEKQIVIYDAGSSAMAAARAWWLMRILNYPRVAVLNGGFAAWIVKQLPVSPGRNPKHYQPGFPTEFAKYDQDKYLSASSLIDQLAKKNILLIDARVAERFRGDVEPLDKKAGHIPGAVNRPFTENLRDGLFKSAEELQKEFLSLINSSGEYQSEQIVLSCGSGVTACHHLLAMEHAGLRGARIFPPSWSGWIADENNPIAQS